MKRFLIEVPHSADKGSCDEAIQVFLQTGSHFLTHADWGCQDGEHKAWIIVEVEKKKKQCLLYLRFFARQPKLFN